MKEVKSPKGKSNKPLTLCTKKLYLDEVKSWGNTQGHGELEMLKIKMRNWKSRKGEREEVGDPKETDGVDFLLKRLF